MEHPSGLGVYCRTLTTASHGTPKQLATKLKENNFSFVCFMACWQDKQGPGKSFRQLPTNLAVLRQYVVACQAAGLEIYLWGFPWIGHEDAYDQAMREATTACGPGVVKGWLHDPEVSFRDKNAKAAPKSSRGQGEAVDAAPEGDATKVQASAAKLVAQWKKAEGELGLCASGVTSYGMATFHPLPWDTFSGEGAFWGSPQLYTVGATQVDEGIESWRSHGFDVLLPSVPAYGENSAGKLDGHLNRFVDGNENISGFVVWSYPQISPFEFGVFKRWGAMLKAKQCLP